MYAKQPGELIQIDHMTVTKNGITFKHFQAWYPITKCMVVDIYCNAKSRKACKFLHKLIKEMVPELKSIQVDGGSEFMKDFEFECQDLKIPLFVLPPSRPQYNSGVERGNRTFRDEFYRRKDLQVDSIGAIRIELKQALNKYNTYSPHHNLNYMTPLEYNQSFLKAAA